MGAVGGLVLGRGVPPRVVVDHGVGGGQVQAHAAGLEADQEHRHAAFLEVFHRYAAVAGVAGQRHPADLCAVQLGGDQAEHGGELREHQDAPTLVDEFGQHVHQQVELGALLDARGGGRLQQARVAAHLAQLQQRIQDHDLAAREALAGDLGAHLLVHRRAHRLVEVALAALQPDAAHDDGLGRQLGGDVFLAPAQDEGAQARREQVAAHRVAVLLDRRAPGLGELLVGAEKARQQEVELRPQLAEVVLQRRAGETQAVAGLQLADHLRALAGGVLHRLRLVEDQQAPLARLQRLGVAP